MSAVPDAAKELPRAHPYLWVVQTYLDLISGNNRLTYGNGLKRLFVMTSGIDTFNQDDIEDATAKAIKMGIIPFSLHGLMVSSIMKNCKIYAEVLRGLIDERIVSIANGDVTNPAPTVNYNMSRARRNYYLPPRTLLQNAKDAAWGDWGSVTNRFDPITKTIEEVATEAGFVLSRFQGSEGYLSSDSTSFALISNVVSELINVIDRESQGRDGDIDYKKRVRPALQIIWVIAKLLLGDLTDTPSREFMQNVIMEKTYLNIQDGTLAAIPFPIPQTLYGFQDNEQPIGVSMKGRLYLGAVTTAAFYREQSNNS